jgi:hypothetical protein
MRLSFAMLALILLGGICAAQDRDFLTADEVDQVREMQDPTERLKLYIGFAKLRVALVEQAVAKEKAGRTGIIHDTLEDYEKIIEAMDTVSGDALKRKVAVDEGVVAVSAAEKEMLASLKKIQEAAPKDMARYEFALNQAIATTEDSIELASEDLGKRSTEIAAKDAKEKQQREEAMSEGELKDKKQADQKAADSKRKAPSLLRPGEKLPDHP